MAIELKEVALGGIAVAVTVAVFWLWERDITLILVGEYREYLRFILPMAGLALAGSLFLLSGMFIPNAWIAYGAALIGVAAPFFLVDATGVVVGTFALSLLLVSYATRRVRREYAFSLGFSASKIAKAGLPVYFTVVSLVISLFYLAHIDERQAISAFFPKVALDYTLKSISEGKLPLEAGGLDALRAIDPNLRVDDALTTLVKKQLEERGVLLDKLPKAELDRVLNAGRQELAKQFGISLGGSEKVSDVFYRAITDYIEKLLGPYKVYLPFAAAAAFFLAFKTLTIPLYYVSVLLAFLLIKVMLWGKILKREVKQMEMERITL